MKFVSVGICFVSKKPFLSLINCNWNKIENYFPQINVFCYLAQDQFWSSKYYEQRILAKTILSYFPDNIFRTTSSNISFFKMINLDMKMIRLLFQESSLATYRLPHRIPSKQWNTTILKWCFITIILLRF